MYVFVSVQSWMNYILFAFCNQFVHFFFRRVKRVCAWYVAASYWKFGFLTFSFQFFRIKSDDKLFRYRATPTHFPLINVTAFRLAVLVIVSSKLTPQSNWIPNHLNDSIMYSPVQPETKRWASLQYAGNQFPPCWTSKQIIVQSGTYAADMQCTGGTLVQNGLYFSFLTLWFLSKNTPKLI